MRPTEPLFGRSGPLRRMAAALERAASGERGFVLVTGSAGIGKSALVRAAVAEADVVGWGTCVDVAAAPGFWPWMRALDGLVERIGRERSLLAAGTDAPLLSALSRAFGDPGGALAGGERHRLLLMDAVDRWLVRIAADQPVVIVLDDLQWADDSSLALLDLVSRSPEPASVCLVGCYRDDDLAPPARERLAGLAMRAAHIDLAGLDRDAVAAVAAQAGATLGPAELEELHRRAGGHPVFTRELAILAVEGQERGMPSAVRDAIAHRFTRLDPAARHVLQVAALAGNEISQGVVASAAGVSVAEVQDAIAVGADAAVVVDDAGGGVRFAHDLYREAIASLVPHQERPALHQRLAAALADRVATGSATAAEAARHFAAAVTVDGSGRAARWALAAARDDTASLAFTEAAAHLRRWRAAVAAAPTPPAPGDVVDVLVAEADALARSGAPTDARGLLRLAREAAEGAGDAERVARVALAVSRLGARFSSRRDDVVRELEQALDAADGLDVALEAELTATLARELQHSVAAERARAGPLSERALELGRASGDPSTLVACLLARHDVLWTPGSAAERIPIAEEILRAAEAVGDRERRAEALLLLANALLESGSAAFEPVLESCLAVLEELGEQRHRYLAQTRRAALLLLRGELDRADEAIEVAAALGRRIREPDVENVRMSQRLELVRARSDRDALVAFAQEAVAHWTGAPVHAHGVAAGFVARAGDLEAARRHVATVLDLGTWRGDRSYLWSVFVRELAAAAAALGDRSLCAELLEDVEPLTASCGVNGAVVAFAGSHAHVAGVLAGALGRHDAGGLIQEAADVYRRLGARSWLAELRGAAPTTAARRAMVRRGRTWDLCFDGERATVPHSKGLVDIASLVSRPDTDVHVLELYEVAGPGGSSSSEVVDARALRAYRDRLADLDEDIDEATAAADGERLAKAQAERDALLAELGRATTRRTGSRVFANYPAERARKAVAARVREAIRRLEDDLPGMASHLDAALVTGVRCRYRSDGPDRWLVQPG